MPIAVMCPGCNSRLNAPDAAAGKTVKCPKCKAAMVIPVAEDDGGFETVDDVAPRTKHPAPASKKPAVKTDVMLDDDDDDRPKKKRRPADDEGDDDRPKKKGKKKAKTGPAPAVLIGAIVGGALLLGGGAFAVYWFAIRDDEPKETAGGTPPPNGTTPPGGTGPSPTPTGPVKPLMATSDSRSRRISSNNLKEIGLAMHNFHATYNAFPSGVIDSSGNLGLSWRVAILPYIEQDSLYKQFNLKERWDSEQNRKLIPLMPKTYAPPGGAGQTGFTYYRCFTGPDTIFIAPAMGGLAGFPGKGRGIQAITDGSSNTALVVEAGDPVEWTKPDELEYVPSGPLPRVGGVFGDGFHVLFADGSPRFMKSLPPESLRAIITARGGEIVELP